MKFCKEKGLHYISDELFAMSDFGEEKEFVSALALVGDGEGEESPMDASKVHVIYSMSKDFGAAGIRSGFVISPRNRPVLDGSIIANFMQTSILNDHFLTALCNFPTLPTIITTLKTHLAKNDALVTEAFDSWAIDYLPTTAGFHVFAKLGKDAQTWEEEEDIVKRFLDCGVMVGPGKGFGGIDGQVGWIRISFSIEEKKVKEGLRRIGKTLGLKKESGAV
ncbi:hypothetical protein OCU04_001566 [Sclerotinia nivalis]|uniref:Aminotransferase class I/classII large domain-containing protein n=1 Tax=Sclerotinia nivalis TaxID=352851 RepID=A0A9X0AYF4_9HELO|nr:hypothetical protein OCU04_001566 [Sclerotinia nivalis]